MALKSYMTFRKLSYTLMITLSNNQSLQHIIIE